MTNNNRENRTSDHISSYDANTEQISEALKELAETIQREETLVEGMEIDVSVGNERYLKTDIQLTLTPSESGYVSIMEMNDALYGGDTE